MQQSVVDFVLVDMSEGRAVQPDKAEQDGKGVFWRRVIRELACAIIAAGCCEVIFLACAATGLWARGIPLDYDNWGGYLTLAMIVIPQAFGVGYVLWVSVGRRLASRERRGAVGIHALLGSAFGLLFYLLGANVKWIVPWMMPR
jgi:hypothetical protein